MATLAGAGGSASPGIRMRGADVPDGLTGAEPEFQPLIDATAVPAFCEAGVAGGGALGERKRIELLSVGTAIVSPLANWFVGGAPRDAEPCEPGGPYTGVAEPGGGVTGGAGYGDEFSEGGLPCGKPAAGGGANPGAATGGCPGGGICPG